MNFKYLATALLLGGMSFSVSAAWVPYSVSATFTDSGTLTGTIRVNSNPSDCVNIKTIDLVSSTVGGFVGASYNEPSFSSCGFFDDSWNIATFEDQSTPGGTFLRLNVTIRVAELLSSYTFSGFEGFVENGVSVQRDLTGSMSRIATVPLPGTLALAGLALVVGAGLRAVRARA